MADVKALQLAARFSFPPNSLGYCGKNTAGAKFKSCIINGNTKGVKKEIEKFIVHHPYLKTISQITKKSKFSLPTVEAFWLGNSQLKKAKPADYSRLLKNFLRQGVPKDFIKELAKEHPREFIPFHLFQVLFIGVGRASGAVPFNLDSINNCMIRWGKVEKLTKDKIVINLNSLKKTKGLYKLTLKKVVLPFHHWIIPDVKKGDTVAVHWKQAVKVLDSREVKNLEYWTKQTLMQ